MVLRSQKLMEARSDFGREPCFGRSVRLSHWLPPGRSVISRPGPIVLRESSVVLGSLASGALSLSGGEAPESGPLAARPEVERTIGGDCAGRRALPVSVSRLV